MKYENETYGVSFVLPDAITVRQQLQFRDRLLKLNDEDTYTRFWVAALPLVGEWQCELIPDPAAVDLDKETRYSVAGIINWAANIMAGHLLGQDDVPKNL